jgi:hypothetical protein
MQIIIIGKRGDFKGVTISRFWGYLAGGLSASIIVAFVVLGISVANHDVINGYVIDNWQGEINSQRAELDEIQQQTLAKNGAPRAAIVKNAGPSVARRSVSAAHARCVRYSGRRI